MLIKTTRSLSIPQGVYQYRKVFINIRKCLSISLDFIQYHNWRQKCCPMMCILPKGKFNISISAANMIAVYLAWPCREERGSRASLFPLRSNSRTFLHQVTYAMTRHEISLHYHFILPVVIGDSDESCTVGTQSVHSAVTLFHAQNISSFLFY